MAGKLPYNDQDIVFSSNGIVCFPMERLLSRRSLLSFVLSTVLYDEAGYFTWATFLPFNVSSTSRRITFYFLMDQLLVELLPLATFSCSLNASGLFSFLDICPCCSLCSYPFYQIFTGWILCILWFALIFYSSELPSTTACVSVRQWWKT